MADAETLEFTGTLERLVFHNPETQYTVARFVTDDGDPLTIVGNVYNPAEGQTMRVVARWAVHKKYGRQLEVVTYEDILPTTAEGIERYLASRFVKGLGPHLAREVVRVFGDDTIRVLDDEPRRLLEVKGIGPKRLEMIVGAWDEGRSVRRLMMFLTEHGVGGSLAVRIHNRYGSEAIKRIREDPYQLAMDVDRIGFRTADLLALRLGIERESPQRVEAGLLFTLHQQSIASGHVYMPREKLFDEAIKVLGINDRDVLATSIEGPLAAGDLIDEDVYPDRPVYLPAFNAAERELARLLLRMRLDSLFDDVEERPLPPEIETGVIELTGGQTQALRTALASRLSIITGGPGVGKTTLIRRLVAAARVRGMQVILAAPTGRAAKRLAEATGHEAKTIHRTLGFNPIDGGFDKGDRQKLEADLVILDEMSMVDLFLMRDLMRALAPHTQLVLVGDADQLPSVGPGNVLGDLIASRVFPLTRLTEVFRQAADSLIVQVAHEINSGRTPQLPRSDEALTDFYIASVEEPERCAEIVLKLVTERIPERFGLDPLRGVQVITPMHRGDVGTISLNTRLQSALNPDGDEVEVGGKVFRIGDKVMQVRNNYDHDVYNGDIGFVSSYDEEDATLAVSFDERKTVTYHATEIDDLQLAYCVTVHKSQGSEYPAVVLPLLTQHYLLLQRNLLYTAITRGKQLVVVVGSEKALRIAIRNDQIRHRYSHLADRLAAGMQRERGQGALDIDQR